jgi:hypothetical protein
MFTSATTILVETTMDSVTFSLASGEKDMLPPIEVFRMLASGPTRYVPVTANDFRRVELSEIDHSGTV